MGVGGDKPHSSPSLVKLGLRIPENASCAISPKIARQKRAKSSLTQPWIIWFRSSFVRSLNAWHSNCRKSSRSRCQSSRSQRDITCAKIRKIINNSAADCSFSLKFCTNFDHVTLDAVWNFTINGSKVKVTEWHSVSASRNAIIQARISFGRSNLVKIILQTSATCNTCSKS